jgi:hypothetical protein
MFRRVDLKVGAEASHSVGAASAQLTAGRELSKQ